MPPVTLFALAGRQPVPPSLANSALVLIDYQREYLAGPLALPGAEAALGRVEVLLEAARAAGARIVHVAHKGAPGGLFDRAGERGAFIAGLEPRGEERVVEKTRPNAFSDTGLAALVGPAGTAVILAGFMTHNCVSSTARAGLDLGYAVTVAGDACATRDLPAGEGIISAADLHRAELAALADRHAGVFPVAALV